MEFITLTRLQHSGVPADLDPTRFGSPGPNRLADMDPPGSNPLRDMDPPSADLDPQKKLCESIILNVLLKMDDTLLYVPVRTKVCF